MTQPTRNQYLESKVLTASQPQLHLMLLDGAIRFGKQAQEAWQQGEGIAAAEEPLARMFDIIEETVVGLASGDGEIAQQLEEQYAFVYRELAACKINEDQTRLNSCLELLVYQRETWKLATERIDTAEATPVAPPKTAQTAIPPLNLDAGPSTTSGLSLEA